jgi:ATP synthase F1 gamma subunit
MRNRIGSVKSTQKITKALNMVAAAKLKRAQDQAESARPYARKMAAVIANLAAGVSGDGAPKLLAGTGKDQKHLIVVATGDKGLHAYFVHSYELKAAQPDMIVATTNYGGPVTAMVGHGNIAGTQFHPEKSQTLGLALIANFMRWTP